ncbi:TRAP transporter substrate-binding protein [Desulfoluna butyratoxydans]|uniref:Trap transporter solute receptor dctp/teaa n=1 Tax=Desulfoluna butyratoxydans TaxID=231438 RepID=A0A4U8YT55_9BACT|nr:TRAP transporter substrate-binding protein [Desulfoluna butyratoxydans]VFQ47160.1 trap transporter solute receptor dctp/teaa [Desulfoluna butyratoxydans]
MGKRTKAMGPGWAVRAVLLGVLVLVGCSGDNGAGKKAAPEKAAATKTASPLEQWRPGFDPSTATYRCIVSNVSHPVMKGVYAGFAIRDVLWERTGGKIYFDYRPLSVLGGEVEVLGQLQMGAIQGMAVSSVAATNLGPRFGLVNLPYLVNTFDKLDRFIKSGPLFDHFMRAMAHQGITGLDITGYGSYGWATTTPVTQLAEAGKVKFRIAEAGVNKSLYDAWGLNPVVMPWPDVPVSLKQGVITGLDHTPMVCNITKKFEVAKHYTRVNYAQGLFIWVFNSAWLESLPEDLRATFIEVVHEVCAEIREETRAQEEAQIADAKAKGVTFYALPEAEMAQLKEKGDSVHQAWKEEINRLGDGDTYRPKDYLSEVRNHLGYTN